MDIGVIIFSAFRGVAKVLLIALGGMILSWRGILDLNTARSLSKCYFNLLMPCLLFISLSTAITRDDLDIVLDIVLFSGCHITILFAMGYLIRLFLKPPENMKNMVIVTTVFGNVGDMVMAIVLGIGTNKALFGENGVVDGLAFVSIYTSVFSVFQFTVGDNLIRSEMEKRLQEGHSDLPEDHEHLHSLNHEEKEIGMNGKYILLAERNGTESDQESEGEHGEDYPINGDANGEANTQADAKTQRQKKHLEKMHKLHQFTSVHNLLPVPTTPPNEANSTTSASASASTALAAITTSDHNPSKFRIFINKISTFCTLPPKLRFLKRLSTPPNFAMLIGLVVALITPLQHLLYNPHSDSEPPLKFVYDTLNLVGMAAVPIGITNVGGVFAKFSFKNTNVPWKITISICVVKMILMPLIGMGSLYVLSYMTGVISPDQKMLLFVFMMECCVPAAQTTVSLYQLHGGDGNEVAGVMLLQYLITIITMPVCISLALYILNQ